LTFTADTIRENAFPARAIRDVDDIRLRVHHKLSRGIDQSDETRTRNVGLLQGVTGIGKVFDTENTLTVQDVRTHLTVSSAVDQVSVTSDLITSRVTSARLTF